MSSKYNDYDNIRGDHDNRFVLNEFQRLLRKSGTKRLIYGIEHLNEFRNYDDVSVEPTSSRFSSVASKRQVLFYCDLCNLELSSQYYECIFHLADYVHLFRYAKKNYPIEYGRLLTGSINPDTFEVEIDMAINGIQLLLKTLKQKLKPKDPQIHVVVGKLEEEFDCCK
jgi:hypothetical protein